MGEGTPNPRDALALHRAAHCQPASLQAVLLHRSANRLGGIDVPRALDANRGMFLRPIPCFRAGAPDREQALFPLGPTSTPPDVQ